MVREPLGSLRDCKSLVDNLDLRTGTVNFRRGTAPSSHGADFFRFDFVGDADFAGLAVRIDGLAQIFFRKLVDVLVRTIFGDFKDAAANFQVAIGSRQITARYT